MKGEAEKAKYLAKRLGGGWKMLHGIVGNVVLTTVEAQKLVDERDELVSALELTANRFHSALVEQPIRDADEVLEAARVLIAKHKEKE